MKKICPKNIRIVSHMPEWAERCQKVQKRSDQALYAIVQGGLFPQLRHQSAAYLTSLGFSGYAIGGLSLGEPKKITFDITEEKAHDVRRQLEERRGKA